MSNTIAKFRLEAFHNQKGLCFYCKSRMWLTDIGSFANKHAIPKATAVRFQCTAEHLTARCEGGKTNKSNIVAACRFCNTKRHQRKNPPDPDQYLTYIKKQLGRGKWLPKELRHIVSKPAAGKEVR